MLRTLVGYIAAVVVAHITGATAAAQHVIAHHEAMAKSSVSFSERISWTLGDILGMFTGAIYPAAIAVALLLAFSIAGFIVRRVGGLRTLGFVLAGGLGLLAMHLILNSLFGMNPIAATRELSGLIAQMLAGALGGWAYVLAHPSQPVADSRSGS